MTLPAFYDGQADYLAKLNAMWGDSALALRTDLVEPGGAARVGFTQTGDGGAARTVQDKERDIVCATDFYANGVSGALVDPTGVTVSGAGIQAALAQADTYLPDGTFLHNGLIKIPSSRTLRGAGASSVLKRADAAGAYASVINSDYAANTVGNSDVAVLDLCFEENGVNQGYAEHRHAIALIGVTRGRVSGCTFKDPSGDAVYISSSADATPRANYSRAIRVNDCAFVGSNANRNGVSIVDAVDVIISDCSFNGMASASMPGAIDLEPDKVTHRVELVIVRGCTFTNCHQAVQVYNAVGASVDTISISGCVVFNTNNNGNAFALIAGTAISVTGCVIHSAALSGITTAGCSILNISSNVIYGAASIGIWVSGGTSSSVNGNTVYATGNDGIRLSSITGGVCEANNVENWGLPYSAIHAENSVDSLIGRNVIDGQSRAAAVGILATGTTVGLRGLSTNVIRATTTPFTLTANNDLGAAAPLAGTWRVGERCQNIAPAVGQPKGWMCTVAGTPGTWVSEGNL